MERYCEECNSDVRPTTLGECPNCSAEIGYAECEGDCQDPNCSCQAPNAKGEIHDN